MAAAGPVDFSDLSPDAFRQLFRASLGALDQAAAADPEEDVEDRSIPGPAGPLRLRIYRPRGPGAESAPLVTFFHGGAGSHRVLSSHIGAAEDHVTRDEGDHRDREDDDEPGHQMPARQGRLPDE